MIDQLFAVTTAARQFGIGKYAFDRAPTDRMHRHGGAPAPAFGHGVITIDLFAQHALAQPAQFRWRRFPIIIDIEFVFASVMSGH